MGASSGSGSSLSLQDVLSNGLIAVIVLLVIAMTRSGTGRMLQRIKEIHPASVYSPAWIKFVDYKPRAAEEKRYHAMVQISLDGPEVSNAGLHVDGGGGAEVWRGGANGEDWVVFVDGSSKTSRHVTLRAASGVERARVRVSFDDGVVCDSAVVLVAKHGSVPVEQTLVSLAWDAQGNPEVPPECGGE